LKLRITGRMKTADAWVPPVSWVVSLYGDAARLTGRRGFYGGCSSPL